MKRFVFSADSHVVEPGELFRDMLPSSYRDAWALHTGRNGEYIEAKVGQRIVHRLRLNSDKKDRMGQQPDGVRDMVVRQKDMARDGIDAEICFPTLALWTYFILDPDAELASTQVYNDWLNSNLSPFPYRFVRCGVLPVRDFANTVHEMKRVAALGFTAVMLPSVSPTGLPAYNDDAWDPVFAAAGDLDLPVVFHTGTGLDDVVVERGPGGAVINYTRQLIDGCDTAMKLVAGGVLDRNPKAKVLHVEAGASWLAALSERMDEVYDAHHFYVRPKLGRRPSEIIRDQVRCSFQHDRACIMSRSVTGTEALLWASDYPHAEGTFPLSQSVINGLFAGIEISEAEKSAILGGNGAKLFRLPIEA